MIRAGMESWQPMNYNSLHNHGAAQKKNDKICGFQSELANAVAHLDAYHQDLSQVVLGWSALGSRR